MTEISFFENKRFMRFVCACAVVIFLLVVLFPEGVRGETETITTESLSTTTDLVGVGQAGSGFQTPNFKYLYYDSSIYNYISVIQLKLDAGYNFGYFGNYTRFTITDNGTGGGIVYYQLASHSIYFVPDPGATMIKSPLTINYDQNIFNNMSDIDAPASFYCTGFTPVDCGILAATPYFAYYNNDSDGNTYFMPGISTIYTVSTRTTDTYILDYVSVNGIPNFDLTINKDNTLGAVGTKYFLYNSTGYILNETYFNNLTLKVINPYTSGLYANTTHSLGGYTITILNSSGTTPTRDTTPPTIDPITGVGIQFDSADYAIGDIANISWIRTIPTPFLDTDYIVVTRPDGGEDEVVTFPPDSGYTKVLMSPSGTWNVEFRRASILFGVSVLASATATVGAETPSYIYAPANIAVGKRFNATYKIGFIPSNAFIETQFYNSSGGWEHELYYGTTGIRGTEANATILVKRPGKYLIVLGDAIGGNKASTQTTAFFNGTDPVLNISVSNISIDKGSYSFGEHMGVTVFVDNFNWSNKQIYVDSYNWEYGVAQSQQQIQSQHEVFDQFISDTTFASPGMSAMRLMGKNDTGTYIIAFKNFTLSNLDTEGYGLSTSKTDLCKGETANIKVIVPVGTVANLSISADNARENKEYIINGSTKTIPYSFKSDGTYYITLRVSGEAKRLIVLNTKTCAVITPTPTPISGVGQAQQLVGLITSTVFWALLITAGLMIAMAFKTRDGFATGTLGMLSAGVFAFMGWLPLWIFFSVLIIGALLLASSIVAKQFNKTG